MISDQDFLRYLNEVNGTALAAVMICLIIILQTSWKNAKWYIRLLTVPLIWAIGASIVAPAWGEYADKSDTFLSVTWAVSMIACCFFFKDIPNPFGAPGRSIISHVKNSAEEIFRE